MSSEKDLLIKYPWIDLNLFKNILNNDLPVKDILRILVKSAVENGENFSSFLLRACVEFTINTENDIFTKQFIIKTSLGDKLIRSRDVFAKEIFIYEKIIPRIEHILRHRNIAVKLIPK